MNIILKKNYFLLLINSAVLLIYYFILQFIYDDGALILSACLYILQMLLFRVLFLAELKKAHRSFFNGDIKNAIELYGKALSFFEKNSWMDRYRAALFLTSNFYSYQEIARLCLDECYNEKEHNI
jgi:hypothetical protein